MILFYYLRLANYSVEKAQELFFAGTRIHNRVVSAASQATNVVKDQVKTGKIVSSNGMTNDIAGIMGNMVTGFNKELYGALEADYAKKFGIDPSSYVPLKVLSGISVVFAYLTFRTMNSASLLAARTIACLRYLCHSSKI